MRPGQQHLDLVWADQGVDDGNGHIARASASRMQRLKEVLDMRECCIAQLQEKLREQQAQHAQVLLPVLHYSPCIHGATVIAHLWKSCHSLCCIDV